MIFIAVGSQKFQFNRLLKKVDVLIEKKVITTEVFAQIGNSDYLPKNYPYELFLDKIKYEKTINESNLVITHGGVGTIVTAINKKKAVIVCPRLKEYGEHVDDHQLDIANAFSFKNLVIKCIDIEALEQSIELALDHRFDEYISKRENIIQVIDEFIENEV